jgi:hypothetical protein
MPGSARTKWANRGEIRLEVVDLQLSEINFKKTRFEQQSRQHAKEALKR